MKREKVKKVLSVVGNVLLWVLVAIGLFAIVVTITAKRDADNTATVFGYQLRFVKSNSMEKHDSMDYTDLAIKDIPVKSCVFVQVAPDDSLNADGSVDPAKAEVLANWYSQLKVGDVLTFKYLYTQQETITHRITEIIPHEEGNPSAGYIIRLEGDNKGSDANTLTQEIDTAKKGQPGYYHYVIGKVTGQSYLLGLLIYILSTPVGIICVIMVPCLVVIVWQIIRIVNVLGAERKAKQAEIQAKQASEIDELRRQLEMLTKMQGANAPPQSASEPTDDVATSQPPQTNVDTPADDVNKDDADDKAE